MRVVGTFDRGLVSAETVGEKTGDAPDGRNADTREAVYFPVGQALLQEFDDLPTIHERLQLCRSAQILEEIAAFVDGLEAAESSAQSVLGTCLLTFCFVSVGLHSMYQCINALVR